MNERPAQACARGADTAACWPLVAAGVDEWADRLALATVVATADPVEGLAAVWAGVTALTGAARVLATRSTVDAIAWEQARPCASDVVRALSDAPSLPDALRLTAGQGWRTTPALVIYAVGMHAATSDQRCIRHQGGDETAVDNARTGLVVLSRHLARVLSVVSLRATCPADRTAASGAAGHAERLAATLSAALPGARSSVAGAGLPRRQVRQPVSIPPAA